MHKILVIYRFMWQK